ncbi:phosphatase PAP2 family protein [Lysinibacter cavernae]|uniref:Undecaprenyl-diphosphatase n=1 Tax=Lysinibacter cavernae TaxID=1640652 RepID=A0A7X5TUZ9_9MICO|nr:phosphatase PAP2 family protein [Lysinibacter cavernae]NIH55194.1 undecaprenyl-diphosphatase [Lysinibacter cavernae]
MSITTERKISRRWPIVSGVTALVLALALGGVLVLRNAEPLGFDQSWMSDMLLIRTPVGEGVALLFNYLGGGIIGVFVVPISTVVILLLLRRRWAALFYAISAAASAGLVQLLKHLVGRARPEDILVHADFGSFPSGHSANAATIAVTLGFIFPKVWVWIAGACYTALMMLSRTYLGAHWLSDTIGGVLLGAGVALVVWAPLAYRLANERETLRRRKTPA